MRVSELIDILRDQDPESEVELAIVAPVDEESDDITVDRYTLEGVLPWEADEDSADGAAIWLVGGEEADVDAFLDAVEADEDGDHDHDHDHDGHDHGHDHGDHVHDHPDDGPAAG